MKKYLVVYLFNGRRTILDKLLGNKKSGMGNTLIIANQSIVRDIEAIRETEKTICKDNNFEQCIILNVTELGEDNG